MIIDNEPFKNPLFDPLRPALSQFIVKPPSIADLNRILRIENIRFTPQAPKSENFADGYEPRIFLKQEVQTRDNCWHDFFNALVWHRFLQSKLMINRLHFNLQKVRYPSKRRTPPEDMLTLFDENGAVVIASHEHYVKLIRDHRWHELFWHHRNDLQRDVKVIVFGHALYEKALQPYIGLTAKCLLFVSDDKSELGADKLVANFLEQTSHDLTPSLLSPLPVLGLPGWWEHNDNEHFYQNKQYFRPRVTC